MSFYKFPHTEPGLVAILKATLPNNRKRSVTVSVFLGPMVVNSYWDGGSRRTFHLYDLATKRIYPVPTSHPFFDRKQNGDRCGRLEISELPENCVLVEGGTFCGKPATPHLYFRRDNLVTLLPAEGGAI